MIVDFVMLGLGQSAWLLSVEHEDDDDWDKCWVSVGLMEQVRNKQRRKLTNPGLP